MSAFGTKKPDGDLGVQLTFPAEFSRAYKLKKLGERYAMSDIKPVQQEYVGDDYMALLHQQHRTEAHQRVMNAVKDTREATRRAFSSHAGYYGLPQPVLTQRVRGSNFGVGVGGGMGYPSPIAGAGAALEGGVIGSREGRVWVRDALQRRKAELDAIDAGRLEGPSIQAQVAGRAPNDFSELSRIELTTYLDQLSAQLLGNNPTLAPDSFRKFLTLLVRFAVVADPRELEDITARVMRIITELNNLPAQEDEGGFAPGPGYTQTLEFREQIGDYLEKIYTYLRGMFRGLSMSPEDRATLSKSLLRDLKFGAVDDDIREWARKASNLPPFKGPVFRAKGGDDDLPGDDDEGGDEGERGARMMRAVDLGMAGVSRGTGARGVAASMFSAPGISRELSSGPAYLSRDVLRQPDIRDRFGAQGQAGDARPQRRYAAEQEGPGLQDEEDFQGDVEEAAAAAAAPGLGNEYDLAAAAQAAEMGARLRRDFPEGTFARLRQASLLPAGAEEPAAAAAAAPAPASAAGAFRSARDMFGSIPGSRLPTTAADFVFQGTRGDPSNIDVWAATAFSGKKDLPQMLRLTNTFKEAIGERPVRSSDPAYVRRELKTMLKRIVEAPRQGAPSLGVEDF